MNAALQPRRIILTTVVNDHFLFVNIGLIPGYESFHFSFGPPLLLTIQEKYEFSTSYKDQRLADYYIFKKKKTRYIHRETVVNLVHGLYSSS